MWHLLLALACGPSSEPAPAPSPQRAPSPGLQPAGSPEAPSPAVAPAAPQIEPLPASGPFARTLAPGLTVAAYLPPEIPDDGYTRVDPAAVDSDPRLFVVTIDPAHYALRYLSTLDEAVGGAPRTARAWAEDHGLHVAFNPGMFEPDARATGHTRAEGFVSQPEVRGNGLYRGWFVARDGRAAVLDHVPPKGSGTYRPYEALPASFRDQLAGWTLVSQSLPILRDGRAAYPPRNNVWSELAYGTDDAGRIVVVFSRFPYEMRELGRRIEALDLGVHGLLHGEGGPEASLVVRAGGVELVRMGSYETGFFDDGNDALWPLPAVLGAVPRRP